MSRSEDQVLVRCLALVALSVFLMLVAHLLAFVGSVASAGHPWRTPYWLGYVLLYPAAGVTIARLTRGSLMALTLCLCAPPVLYFTSLGVLEGNWSASDGALWGALLALGVTAIGVYFANRPGRQASPSV
jgi:hypothetical protein